MIINPKCGQALPPDTPVDGADPGSEGKKFPPLGKGEERTGSCRATTNVVTYKYNDDGTVTTYQEHLNDDGSTTLRKEDEHGRLTGESETRDKQEEPLKQYQLMVLKQNIIQKLVIQLKKLIQMVIR